MGTCDSDEAEQALNAIRSLRMVVLNGGGNSLQAMLRAISTAFAVTYCRCFQGDDERGNRLVASTVFLDAPAGLREHEYVFALRHKFYAHDGSDYRQAIVAALFDATGELVMLPAVETFGDRSDLLGNNGPLFIKASCRYLSTEIARLHEQIIEEVKAMSPAARSALKHPVHYPTNPADVGRPRSGKRR